MNLYIVIPKRKNESKEMSRKKVNQKAVKSAPHQRLKESKNNFCFSFSDLYFYRLQKKLT